MSGKGFLSENKQDLKEKEQRGIQHNKQERFWSTSKEIEYAWRETFRKKCGKQWNVCARKTTKKVYRSETIQYDTKEHKRSKDKRWLQTQAKRMDMGKHLLIWLSSY